MQRLYIKQHQFKNVKNIAKTGIIIILAENVVCLRGDATNPIEKS